MLKTPFIKKIINDGANSLADLFIGYDKKNYSQAFNSIAEYIKKADITNILK